MADQLELVPRCAFCDRESVWLCDAKIGWLGQSYQQPLAAAHGGRKTKAKWPAQQVFDPSLIVFTCDLPLCDEHVRKSGPMFVCGGGGCDVAFDDYCPLHSDQEIMSMGRKDFITATEAETRRDDLRRRAAAARRVLISIKPRGGVTA